jgi:hypothetical protein
VAPTTQTPVHPFNFALMAFWWSTMLISCAIEAAPRLADRSENCDAGDGLRRHGHAKESADRK